MSAAPEPVDTVVIGSGFGGSVAAARLATQGKVVVLERGKRWEDAALTQTLDVPHWSKLYDFLPGPGILAMGGKGVGGGSLVYSNVSLRAPTGVFDLTDASGRRLWPSAYTRAELDPYYRRVEQLLGVVQLSWNPPPGHEWRTVAQADRVFGEGLGAIGKSCEPARVALGDCTGCGWCNAGCSLGRKNTLAKNYLPLAEAHGASIRPEHEATSLVPHKGGWRVRFRRHDRGRRRDRGELRCKRVVVACGAYRSPYLLQRSRLRVRGQSQHVGRNLSVNGDIMFNAMLPEGRTVNAYKGPVIGSVTYGYLDQGFVFQRLTTPPHAALLTSQVPGSGARIGPEYKRWVRRWGENSLGIAAFGVDAGDGQVLPGPTGPVLRYKQSARTRAYYARVHAAAKDLVERGLGGHLAPSIPQRFGLIETVHPLGSCRMAEEGPEHGAVDPDGQVWGHPGLYVLDGSTIPTASVVNPSLTIAAVAERCVERMLEAA